jgi:uncharacterized integral membrane protein (TIGR00698 family)
VRITLGQIASLGIVPVVTVAVSVASTILIGLLLARRLRLSDMFGVLSGGAVAICGASAALAIASVLPRDKDRERDTILTVVAVTALSTLAMILYPVFATSIGLDHKHSGVFIGGTIHDVAQVVGAGYMISPETGDVATYVKLLRVAMLLPTVFAISLVAARNGGGKGSRPSLPLFLVGFALLVLANSFGLLPRLTVDFANDVSRWSLVAAIAALGMKTSFGSVRRRFSPAGADGGRDLVDRRPGDDLHRRVHVRKSLDSLLRPRRPTSNLIRRGGVWPDLFWAGGLTEDVPGKRPWLIGVMRSAFLSGRLSDRFGRKARLQESPRE